MDTVTVHNKKFKLAIASKVILKAVKQIAGSLNAEYKNKPAPIFLCILNGSFMFASELLKEITFNCRVSFIKLSSYKNDTSCGEVTEIIGLSDDITNQDIIILEDIIDTGLTVENIINRLNHKNPRSVKIITLFFKAKAFKKNFKIHHIGMHVPDKFLIGFGLDYNGLGRNYKNLYELAE